MTCTPVKIGGTVAIVCSRGRDRVRMCSVAGCKSTARRQCDYPDAGHRSGTCDKWLCDKHAVPQGRNKDYCPEHPGQGDLFAAPKEAKP